jgi:Flp pilus assembly protein TadG
VELVLIAPVLLILLLGVVAFGRLAASRLDVNSAARQAARAASIERSPGMAASAASAVAAAAMSGQPVTCRQMTVTTDTSSFRPGGSVSVTVRCSVQLADLALVRLPGTETIVGEFTESIDLYRGTS